MNAPNHSDLYRGLGEVEGRLRAMDDRLNKIENVVDRIDTRLARMEAAESTRKGAVTVLAALAGVAGAVVSFIVEHLWK